MEVLQHEHDKVDARAQHEGGMHVVGQPTPSHHSGRFQETFRQRNAPGGQHASSPC